MSIPIVKRSWINKTIPEERSNALVAHAKKKWNEKKLFNKRSLFIFLKWAHWIGTYLKWKKKKYWKYCHDNIVLIVITIVEIEITLNIFVANDFVTTIQLFSRNTKAHLATKESLRSMKNRHFMDFSIFRFLKFIDQQFFVVINAQRNVR